MSEARKVLLSSVMEEIGSAEGVMDGILDIMVAAGLEGETDDFEIDFDALPNPTLWELDAYMQHASEGAYDPETALGIGLRAGRGGSQARSRAAPAADSEDEEWISEDDDDDM